MTIPQDPQYSRDGETFDGTAAHNGHYAEQPAENAPAPVPAPAAHTNHVDDTYKKKVKGSFAGSTWLALIVGALLLILLIVFMMQNQQQVPITLFAWSGTLPAGIAFLLFSIGGALVMALVGGWRMLELRRQVKNR